MLLLTIQAGFCWLARGRSLRGEIDLRSFYAAGSLVRSGHADQLYDPGVEAHTQQSIFADGSRTLPFLYPAFAALPFVPLTRLSYPSAFLVLLFANLTFLYLCAHLLLPSLAVPGLSRAWLFCVFVSFFPAAIALMQGQLSCVLLLIFVGSEVLARRGKPFLSGLLLSLALVKFQIAVPFVLFSLISRKRSFPAGFVVGASGLVTLSVWLAGVNGTRAYLLRLKGVGGSMLLDHAAAQARFGMQTASEPNLHGLIASLAGAGLVGALLTGVGSLGVALAALRYRSPSTALPAALLVSYHLQPYDLLLLLFPLALLFAQRNSDRPTPLRAGVLFASLATLSIPLAPLLLLGQLTPWFVLPMGGIFWATLRFGDGQQHIFGDSMHGPTAFGRT